jgi:hypothetical protein
MIVLVTERDSPALALVLAPALARTVYLLATSPTAILPLLQLRILVLCNPQPMEHLHIFPVPCRHIILSSSSSVAADDVNFRLDSNERTDERTAGEPNSLLKKAGEHTPVLQITEARAQNSKNALARRALAARARANP